MATMMICIAVIGVFEITSRGSLCTSYSRVDGRLVRPRNPERSTFFIDAPIGTILKVSRVGFMALPEYGIFSDSIRTCENKTP
jgi:hypothetical protein